VEEFASAIVVICVDTPIVAQCYERRNCKKSTPAVNPETLVNPENLVNL
jgi:hypothetical protein